MRAWRALDKATIQIGGQPVLAKTRVRRDHVDRWGSVTLHYRRKLHHISVRRPYRGQRILMLMADLDVRVITDEGELLRHFTLDPTMDYQAKSRSTRLVCPSKDETSHWCRRPDGNSSATLHARLNGAFETSPIRNDDNAK